MELRNCYRCGRLFAKAFRDLCPNCLKDIEAEYNKCMDYLRKERKASMSELSEATGVSIAQITKFIREGRISIADLPNMFLGCETCGATIREGNLCETCRRRLLGDLQKSHETKAQAEAKEAKNMTYRTMQE